MLCRLLITESQNLAPSVLASQRPETSRSPSGVTPGVTQTGLFLTRRLSAPREAELLPVQYFHLVFTLPKQIADIAHQNKRETYNLLMRASADTVIKIAADPKWSCPACVPVYQLI
jgi:hypothetical protein